jgi:hypothetical protein
VFSGFLVHGFQAEVFGNLKKRFNLVIDAGIFGYGNKQHYCFGIRGDCF